MAGQFSSKDVSMIKQSVRKDGYWTFFKRNLQIQKDLLNKKLIISDIGCGTGDTCILVNNTLSYVLDEYNCIDASNDMLDYIRLEKFEKTNYICINLDSKKELEKLPASDVYISKFMFHHLKNKEVLLTELYKKLPKNGCILLIDKFPSISVFITNLVEYILDKLKIKIKLGNHYYTRLLDFYSLIQEAGFTIEDEIIKKPNKLKNFFILKVFLVLRK